MDVNEKSECCKLLVFWDTRVTCVTTVYFLPDNQYVIFASIWPLNEIYLIFNYFLKVFVSLFFKFRKWTNMEYKIS